jgi:hypothetical protein
MFRDCFLAVRPCTKGCFEDVGGHGKSPCFSRVPALSVVSAGWMGSVFAVVSMGDFLG